MVPEEDELPSLDEAEPPPFEGEGSFFGRYWRELRAGFRPRVTAPSYALDDRVGPAVAFFLLTFVPLSLLHGIIPWTHTLRFGNVFGVERIGEGDVFVDVLRAMGIGLLIQGVMAIAFVAAFQSLTRAYGKAREGAATENLGRIAFRAALYRAWWLPLQGTFGLPVMLLFWAMPKDMPGALLLLPLLILSIAPVVLHFVGMRHVARQACGVGPLASFAVVVVPYVLMMVLQTLLIGDGTSDALLTDWLPEPPEPPAE